MSKQKHKSLVLLGNVGSGKTTLMTALGEKLPVLIIPADELYKENPFFLPSTSDWSRWTLTSNIWFLNERVKLLKKNENFLKKSDVVIDSGLLMSVIYAYFSYQKGSTTKEEWELYMSLYKELTPDLTPPDVVLYLDIPVPSLLKRITKRGRQYEIEKYNAEYLINLTQAIEWNLKQLQESSPQTSVIRITEQELDLTKIDHLLKKIENLLKNK